MGWMSFVQIVKITKYWTNESKIVLTQSFLSKAQHLK